VRGLLASLATDPRLERPNLAYWDYSHPEEIMAEIGSVVPEYAGVKYERIEKTGLQVPVWDDENPGTPFLFGETFPSGRGKFHPLEYVPLVELPDDEYPFILTTGRVLEHWHGGTLTRHSKLDELYPEARVEVSPADASLSGVADGQTVRVSSRRGSIVLRPTAGRSSSPSTLPKPPQTCSPSTPLIRRRSSPSSRPAQ
jgi:predicted molibdopterin-dependent oxidoreductase YjgC